MLPVLRRHRRFLTIFALLVLVSGAALLLSAGWSPLTATSQQPRLAVLVVFDQMRGDYLERWQDLFDPEGGFVRLQREGAWFRNCHYPYANTVTAAGHASILTGCSPDQHGIIGNSWYDRESGTSVYCVSSERHDQVPARAAREGKSPKAGVSPDRLLAPTLGDVIKAATDGQGKVIGLSLKDRSAVLPAGHRVDLSCWLDSDTGQFCTSTFYKDRLPAWVAEFNQARPTDRWFGRDWLRLRPDLNYVRFSGADDVEGEGNGFHQGRTFPHPMTGGLRQPGKDYYNAVTNTPFGNELLLDLAKRAVDAEHLGQGPAPDLLCISFSSNDIVGHSWGPDSQEVLDITLRSDLIVRDLLAHLDAQVGRGRYVLALTADHGVCPLPEVSHAHGREAGRVPFALLATEAEEFLAAHYSLNVRWFDNATNAPWFYLNRRLLKDRKLEQSEVEQTLAEWLGRHRGIARAYTRTQLQSTRPHDEDERVWKSFHPDRSGDVYAVLQPYWIWTLPFEGGTSHGTPHPYDTHVPLLAYGPGVPAGPRTDPVTPQAAAAILARLLKLPPPARAEAPVPAGIGGKD